MAFLKCECKIGFDIANRKTSERLYAIINYGLSWENLKHTKKLLMIKASQIKYNQASARQIAKEINDYHATLYRRRSI